MPRTIPDLLDFIPLFDEDEASVWGRIADWANEEVEPTDPGWVDTREGGFFWINTRPVSKEIARLYDRAGSEAPAAAQPLWTWGPYLETWAEVFELEREAATAAVGTVTFKAPEGTLIPAGVEVSTAPLEGSGIDPVQFAVAETGTVGPAKEISLPIKALTLGSQGNVAAGAIESLSSQVPNVTSLTNSDATFGGKDEEGDESLKERLLELLSGEPTANVYWYLRIVKAWLQANDPLHCPLGGRITVKPLWEGAGTVLIVATDDSGNELEPEVVTGLQDYLDPASGEAKGVAPVAAEVTVETATTLEANFAATITFEPGYNLDGAHSLIGLSAKITDAVSTYTDSLGSGEEVVWSKALAAIVGVQGVKDASALEINGKAESLKVNSVPPEVARLGETTWTDAEPSRE